MLSDGLRVRHLFVFLVLAASAGVAYSSETPLPRPRPADTSAAEAAAPALPAEPSACRMRLRPEFAQFEAQPPAAGPGECGAADVVRLEAVVLPNQARVSVAPPAVLRCEMAEVVVHWVRDILAPAALELGAPLMAIDNFASYECRGRNRIEGAKLSEHGRANALDVRSLRLADGRIIALTDAKVAKTWRDELRQSTCARFTTVLGPGSDGFHETHIHLDLAERRGGYRMCQWDLLDAADLISVSAVDAIPIPRPRPPMPRSEDAGAATGRGRL
jgi:hypothetical protein